MINIVATGDINIGSGNNPNAYISANGIAGGTINIVSANGNVNHYGVIDALGLNGAGGQAILAGFNGTNFVGGLISADGLSQGGLIGLGIINANGSRAMLTPPATAPPATATAMNSIVSGIGSFVSGGTSLDSQTGITANAANSSTNTQAGQIYIAGDHFLNIAATITANADNGGLIILSSPSGTYQNTGYIQTNGGAGLGGTIAQSGLISTILRGATVEAEGASGGGNIITGHDFQSSPRSGSATQDATLPILSGIVALPTSQLTVIDANSSLSANAVALGNGGNVLTWGDALAVYGSLSANGGSLGGNGGLLETSGNYLDTSGINVSAISNGGFAGTWLLDPYDVYIGTSVSGTAFSASGATYVYTPTTLSYITAASVSAALNAGTNVAITTGAEGSNTIYVQNAISGTSVNASLTLTAGTINIRANISTVGSQTYNGNVVLSGAAVLSATGITGSTIYTSTCGTSGTTACVAPALTNYTVPAGVTSIQITLIGGSGGYGGLDTRAGNQTGVSGSYTFTMSVIPGEILTIAPGGGGGGGGNRVTSTGGGGAGTNRLLIASGGTGGATGDNGNSGGGGGGGAASVVQLKNSSGTVLATFYGAGAGGGGGGNNTLQPTAAGLGGTSPGLDAGQYQTSSSTGAIGGKPHTAAGGSADGGGGGGGGGGLLGGLTPPSTIQSYYTPSTTTLLSLLGCTFCNAPILSLNGSGEWIGQGGNRGSNGYTVASGQSVALTNVIDTTYSWGTISSGVGIPGYNGSVTVALPGATGITFNGTVNSATSSANSLSISTGGQVVFNGAVGDVNPLSALTVSASSTTTPSAINTTGNQSYSGAVILGANTSLSTTSNGSVTFNGTVDAASTNGLKINTGTTSSAGAVVFSNSLGATQPIGGLTVTAGKVTGLDIKSSAGITINSAGTANGISLSRLIKNTGAAGTGIVVQAVGNVLLAGVTNSGSLGIKVTGGYGIAVGTTSGGTILDLGTVTNTGGDIAISMGSPTTGNAPAGSVGSPEYEIGLTTSNAYLATNVTYNQVGGSYVKPTNFISGSGYGYVNYRQNSAIAISVALLNDYSQTYGVAYDSTTALNWLRSASDSTVTVTGTGFGFGGNLSQANALSSLIFASSIGGTGNSNNVQSATGLTAGKILSNTGNAVTVTGTAHTYTITAATASLSASNTIVRAPSGSVHLQWQVSTVKPYRSVIVG